MVVALRKELPVKVQKKENCYKAKAEFISRKCGEERKKYR
jgi:hypothetical protein